MADILDEILNDEKDEKRLQVFRKIFPIIITLTIIVALVIAGYSWFSAAKTRHNQEIGDLFVQLMSGEYKNKELVNNLLEEIKVNNENTLSELTAIKLVSRQIQNGDVASTMQSLEAVINNKEYSEITTSYARILYISLILDVENLSSDQENKSREYLQYFNKDSQLFYGTATLLKSLFYIKSKQLDLAKEYATEVLKLSRSSGVIKEQAKAVIAGINMLGKSN